MEGKSSAQRVRFVLYVYSPIGNVRIRGCPDDAEFQTFLSPNYGKIAAECN